MFKKGKLFLLICLPVIGLSACSPNGFIENQQQTNIVATDEKMLTISREIIQNLCSIYTVDSEEKAENILRKSVIARDVYYQQFLNFIRDSGIYESVSVQLSNESVTNLNADNENTIGTIIYTFDISVQGVKEDGSKEIIGEADNLMAQIANYEGRFRMIEIRRQ